MLDLDRVKDHFYELYDSFVLVEFEDFYQLYKKHVQIVDFPQVKQSGVDHWILDEVLDDRLSVLQVFYGVPVVENNGNFIE